MAKSKEVGGGSCVYGEAESGGFAAYQKSVLGGPLPAANSSPAPIHSPGPEAVNLTGNMAKFGGHNKG